MNPEEWAELIEPRGVHKMLYSLQLISQLITVNSDKLSDCEAQERIAWRQRFLQLGGLTHLYKILIDYRLEQAPADMPGEEFKEADLGFKAIEFRGQVDSKITAQCLSHLVSIIKVFVQAAMISTDK